MKLFVNFLSGFRIFAAFAMIPVLMSQMYWTAFILFVLAAASDFFDGFLARKYRVETKIGGVLDHIGDKLLVITTLIMLAIMMPIWFIIVPIVIMIAREIYISGLREFLGTQKIEMPVPAGRFSMGKIKTTLQMVAAGAFLLMFIIGTLMGSMIGGKVILYLVYGLPIAGIALLWLALIASLWSAAQYTMDFAKKFKKIK